MSTYLITGSAGFIGTNLVKFLLDKGETVVGVDNFFCSNRNNHLQFTDNLKYSFIEADIRQPLVYDKPVDYIVNLACPASPPNYQKDPLYTLDTSVLGVKNMLALATQKNAVILQASTSEVYGNPLEHPQKETYWGNVNPIGIRSCYDEGKRIAETYCIEYNRSRQTKIKLIRIFNTYGPYMDPNDGRVVSNFIIQALKGNPLTIYGDGMQTRSFQYIDDLVAGIYAMLHTDNAVTGPINLGNPGEFTMKELADLVIAKINSALTLDFKPLPADDPAKRKPDITKAKELLNWEPVVPLTKGLDKTIAYFRSFAS